MHWRDILRHIRAFPHKPEPLHARDHAPKDGKVIETSITLDYRRNSWGIERIVLDSISNHLPEDAKGSSTTILLKQNGAYVPLHQADRDAETTEIVFEDNGQGYDQGLLSVLYSTKSADAISVGQFGEGLKMVAAASLRHDIRVEYESQDWKATPFAIQTRIGEQDVERLGFIVKNKEPRTGSLTRFIDPSPELVDEVLDLPKKVLAFNEDHLVLHEQRGYGRPARILKTQENAVYIKGIKFHWMNDLLFSYDLPIEDISPDRKHAEWDKVRQSIRPLLQNCTNEDVVERVILAAKERRNERLAEFAALDEEPIDGMGSDPFLDRLNSGYISYRSLRRHHYKNMIQQQYCQPYDDTNTWVAAFHKLFGDDAVLSDDSSADEDARLMGYGVIDLNWSVDRFLRSCGIKGAKSIASEQEYRWVEESDLTADERELLEQTEYMNHFLMEENANATVKVYEGLFNKAGREIASSHGVQLTYRDGKKVVGIKRSVLNDAQGFPETYMHELGHFITGASDYSREFPEFFIGKLAALYRKEYGIPLKEEPASPQSPPGVAIENAASGGIESIVRAMAAEKEPVDYTLPINIRYR